MNTATKFWSSMDSSGGPESCWTWLMCKSHGYGYLSYEGKRWRAHRLAWVLTHGQIPKGMCVCHACDNPPCCNPDHLFVGTQRDNRVDATLKGRSRGGSMPGESNPSAVLCTEAVSRIKASLAAGTPHREIAHHFGISKSSVTRVSNSHSWQVVEPSEVDVWTCPRKRVRQKSHSEEDAKR